MEPTTSTNPDPYPPTLWSSDYTPDYALYRLGEDEDAEQVPCACWESPGWLPLVNGEWTECVVCGGWDDLSL